MRYLITKPFLIVLLVVVAWVAISAQGSAYNYKGWTFWINASPYLADGEYGCRFPGPNGDIELHGIEGVPYKVDEPGELIGACLGAIDQSKGYTSLYIQMIKPKELDCITLGISGWRQIYYRLYYQNGTETGGVYDDISSQWNGAGERWCDRSNPTGNLPGEFVGMDEALLFGFHCTDQNGDGQINLFDDIYEVANDFGFTKSTPEWDYRRDVNEDGVVSLFADIMFTASQFGLDCKDVWKPF